MKRLMVLMVAAVITSTASGCFHWFNRGAACNTCPTSGGAYYGDQYMDAPYVSPEGVLPTPG